MRTYRPALTGLRAIAVAGVMASHAHVPHSGGGIYGVDVFFVLSGYLITSILLDGQELRAFYRNRALRLLPALGVMLLIGLLEFRALSDGHSLGSYGLVVLVTVGYCQNLVLPILHHPFGGLAHTWSLAMEEQFYLLWPAALGWLKRGSRSVVKWSVGGTVVSWVLLVVFLHPHPTVLPSVYYWPWTRVGGLLVGCALAAIEPPPWSRWLGLPAVLGIVAVFALTDGEQWQIGLWIPVVSLLTVALIASLIVDESQSVGRLLASRPVEWIGLISYGLYLFHIPIFDLITSRWHGRRSELIAIETVATIVVAAASYYSVERWFLRRKASASSVAGIPVATPAGQKSK